MQKYWIIDGPCIISTKLQPLLFIVITLKAGGGVILECTNEMTNERRKSCKLPCETAGRDWAESFYNYGAVAYNYMDPRIVHMGKEGVKAGLVRLPRKQSFSIYRGKVVLVMPVASFCTQTRQVGLRYIYTMSLSTMSSVHSIFLYA